MTLCRIWFSNRDSFPPSPVLFGWGLCKRTCIEPLQIAIPIYLPPFCINFLDFLSIWHSPYHDRYTILRSRNQSYNPLDGVGPNQLPLGEQDGVSSLSPSYGSMDTVDSSSSSRYRTRFGRCKSFAFLGAKRRRRGGNWLKRLDSKCATGWWIDLFAPWSEKYYSDNFR